MKTYSMGGRSPPKASAVLALLALLAQSGAGRLNATAKGTYEATAPKAEGRREEGRQ